MTAKSVKVLLLAVAVVGLAVGGWLWSRRGRPSRPHVVLISIDTLRADHLSCYGYPREITPNIDRLAAEGIRFTNVTTTAPLTLPGHATMLTGMIPPVHGVHKNENYRLADANITLAELLRAEGYATGAIVSTPILDAQFGLAQGFETYDDDLPLLQKGVIPGKRRGETTSRLAAEWLDRHAEDERFFLFVHYYDPHTKYDPPEPFASQWPQSPYAGEVAYVDYCVGQVIDKLKALGLYDRTLIILTSDHGEMLGEHGELTHGYFIYESAIKVPLIIKLPGARPARSVVDEAVGLVDIAPTICAMLGVASQPAFSGQDLSPAIQCQADPQPARYLYCESVTPETYDANPLFGMVGAQWKYIETKYSELYDISADPRETTDLIEVHPDQALALSQRLRDVLEQARAAATESRAGMDADARARLESLGYVSGGSRPDTLTLDASKEDPKDVVAFQQDVQRAMKLLPAGRVDETIEILSRLVDERPQAYMSRRLLARSLGMAERYQEGLAHYDILLRKYPSDSDMLSQRAYARQQTGDLAGALADYDQVILLDPDSRGVWHLRGVTHLRFDEPASAVADFTESLRRDPTHIPSLMNRGTALGRQGDLAGAIADWTEVIRLDPTIFQAHVLRAKAKHQAGDTDGALADLTQFLYRIPPSATEPRKKIEGLMAAMRQDR